MWWATELWNPIGKMLPGTPVLGIGSGLKIQVLLPGSGSLGRYFPDLLFYPSWVSFPPTCPLSISEKNFVSDALYGSWATFSDCCLLVDIISPPEALHLRKTQAISVLDFRTFLNQISQNYCGSYICILSVCFMAPKTQSQFFQCSLRFLFLNLLCQ